MSKKSIAIIGGGPSAMLCAAFLDTDIFEVTIYEKNARLGRKFLVAGKGGFNLTHSEDIDLMIEKYVPTDKMQPALQYFSNEKLRIFLASIGVETFVGSSGRVFPVKGINPNDVLTKLLDYVISRGVTIRYNSEWEGWDEDGRNIIAGEPIDNDIHIFALGGGSWKVTGSDGNWLSKFRNIDIAVADLEAANCAYVTPWKPAFITQFEGVPLKNIAIFCNNHFKLGEVVITKQGFEGGAIYALTSTINEQLNKEGECTVYIDMKPMYDRIKIKSLLLKNGHKSITDRLKNQVKLSKADVGLLQHYLSKESYTDIELLVDAIKNFPVVLREKEDIDKAISTIGGVKWEELTPHYELKKLKKSFCLGEMVDWWAPTGGYLLQGCFSMGVYVASYLNERENE